MSVDRATQAPVPPTDRPSGPGSRTTRRLRWLTLASLVVRQGTRPGILTGLAVTGGVITNAGVVLASTFAASGVLLDTLIVRSLLVPALTHDLGRRLWLPHRLGGSGAE